jgi:hypothetical protein
MKKTTLFPRFAPRAARSILFLGVLFFALLGTPACGVKQTVKIKVPPAILQAKTAGFEQLLAIIRESDKIQALACNELHLTLTTSKKLDNGELEKYRTVKGYILLQRPNSTHLVLLMPVTQSKLLDVLSVGNDFSVWYPRKNEFYRGLNSSQVLIVDDPSGPKEFMVPIRGNHIFEAIFPQGVLPDAPGVWITRDEQKDAQASYYILTFAREGARPRAHTFRKIWIERSNLAITRQQVFNDEGQIVSDITYADPIMVGDFSMPQQMRIERPMDGYSLDLSFRNWRINPDLDEEVFQLQPPPGAKVLILRDKETSR